MNEREDVIKSENAKREEEILAFWEKEQIFEKSLSKESPKGEYVFYEGPPTANGRPGVHHIASRAFKDVMLRYKTMRGYHVNRRAGWDTHGLPVELEVEKKLEFTGKKDIEAYGIEAFNKLCKESVFTYVDEWREFSKRIGFWLDHTKAYFTFTPSFMESVWWVIGQANKKNLLYKDYRVVPWCARCGTALSSHELAQGYEEVKDLSVTAKFELVDEPNTYLLAWTTTPWTLPGNVALAVGKDIEYSWVRQGEEVVIVASLRKELLAIEGEVIKTTKGHELIGKSYKPLFGGLDTCAPIEEKVKFEKAFKVYGADFVTTEDGTGIVHTAVMYGADDFELGTKEGLPKVHVVKEDGTYKETLPSFGGRSVLEEELTVDIIKDLAGRGRLFSKAKYDHTYPFCWRCKSRLIYYARDSWYIRMTELKDTLLSENEKIDWTPDHVKHGRFGEWLSTVRDWAISRERYWGTPLPVWESKDKTERIVIDSIETLKKHTAHSGNTYLLMRHGFAENNAKNIANSNDSSMAGGLTPEGKAGVIASAQTLIGKGITKIITSPLNRTKETAEVVRATIGLDESHLVVDERIGEINFGEYNGKSHSEYRARFKPEDASFYERPAGGESWQDVRRRMGAFIYDIENSYKNETILIVGHQGPFFMLDAVSKGTKIGDPYYSDSGEQRYGMKNAQVYPLSFRPIPHNDDYELDLHRPYIDSVVLKSEKGALLFRTPEVMDVWLDSGAVPFAQDHYPFENKEYIEKKGYPADYISEGLDQTRGWFYTMLAVSSIVGRERPYKHVISLGMLLDAKGQKMSKSRGNGVDPWEAMNEYGVDALRYFLFSVNSPGEAKNFDPAIVKEGNTRLMNLIQNTVSFYELYKGGETPFGYGTHILDKWLQERTDVLIETVTEYLDTYDVTSASRAFRDYTADLSQWYVRRSRDRFKGEGKESTEAVASLRTALHTLSRLMAPFTPFFGEWVYLRVRSGGEAESVHLADWPTVKKSFSLFGKKKSTLLSDMEIVRTISSEALALRQKAGVKVRQPLQLLTIPASPIYSHKELMNIVKEELNVKEIKEGKEMTLDTTFSPELIAEGNYRELVRAIQDMRKQEGLTPKDTIALTIAGDAPLPKTFEEDLKRSVRAEKVSRDNAPQKTSIESSEGVLSVSIHANNN